MKIQEIPSEKSKKDGQIIIAAQQRFGLYGVEGTSMQEIADDLGISKASLYYYFPDKQSLYKAVVEKEQIEFIDKISERITVINEPDILLREYSVSRLSYFRTLLNLSRLRMEDFSDLKPVFRESIRLFKEKEIKIVAKIFREGIAKGVFSIADIDQTASLFLDLLRGLRVSVVNEKKTLFIEQEEFNKLLENTVLFTEIFINGLKIK